MSKGIGRDWKGIGAQRAYVLAKVVKEEGSDIVGNAHRQIGRGSVLMCD